MNDDFCFGLQFFKRGHAADVIHVRVRAGDCLQFEIVPVDRFNDVTRAIAGIDANRASGFFTADDAGVLLESGDGDFFDDHGISYLGDLSLLEVLLKGKAFIG